MKFLKSFFSKQNLFQINPAFISPTEKLFLMGGVVLILLSIVLKISAALALSPVDKKYRNKFYRLFLTIGVSELIWYFFRWQNIPYVDTDFVAWLIVLLGLIWFVCAVVYTLKNYKKEQETWEKQQVRQKYLPV